MLFEIAWEHLLCLPTLRFYAQVKHKRKFCSDLIQVYFLKFKTYYITGVFKKFEHIDVEKLLC